MSTTPHMEHRMYLGVIQPKTIVLGPKERYIEKGSTINLTCLIQVSEETMFDIDFVIRTNHNSRPALLT